jgi:hypothetical protein
MRDTWKQRFPQRFPQGTSRSVTYENEEEIRERPLSLLAP